MERTLAMKLLVGKKVSFNTAVYPAAVRDAEQVAQHLRVDAGQVFKTLVVRPPEATGPQSRPLLVMVPANCTLNLKALAKAVGVKKVKLAGREEAEMLTGLQVGGISALALLNKGFKVYLDERARQWERVYVSAGQRGVQIHLAVVDLVRVTRARYAAVAAC